MKSIILCVSVLSLSLAACGQRDHAAEAGPKAVSASDPASSPEIVAKAPVPAENGLDTSIRIFTYPEVAASLRGKAACFLGVVDGDPAAELVSIKKGEQRTLEGWTADELMVVPESIEFVLASADVAYGMPATLGPDKNRAAKLFNNPALANAGYTTVLKTNAMKPGKYQLFIKQIVGEKVGYCPISGKTIVIK